MSAFAKRMMAAARTSTRFMKALIALSLILTFAGIGARAAQALTFTYIGPAFDGTECAAYWAAMEQPGRWFSFHDGDFYRSRIEL